MIANAGSVAGFRVGESQFVAHGSTATGTFFGINKANNAFLMDHNGQYTLTVGTLGATPLVFGTNNAEVMRINSSGNIGIGTSSPTYKLEVVGSFAATTKSFVISHPTKSGKKLQYGSLESPYHGVRLTGEGKIVNGECTIKLPDYIHGLVKQEGSQVQITNIKHGKVIWVEDIDVKNDQFTLKCNIGTIESNNEYNFYWSFTAIRKDIKDLEVEV